MPTVGREQLEALLARLGGPGFKGFDDQNQAVAEMRAVGAELLFPLLTAMLCGNEDSRCAACEGIVRIDADRGLELVLPLLRDPHIGVRTFVCDCVVKFGNSRAVPALLNVLRSDEDAHMRGTAARGLGLHGGPEVIPVLLEVMASDHEKDIHGHSPSHCASMALDDILGTDETCLHFGKVCRMLDREPDLDKLRRLAEDRYQKWLECKG